MTKQTSDPILIEIWARDVRIRELQAEVATLRAAYNFTLRLLTKYNPEGVKRLERFAAMVSLPDDEFEASLANGMKLSERKEGE